MGKSSRWLTFAVLCANALGAAPAAAQVFGTFTWQMQPYCNRVTLTLTTAPGGFTLAGSDDQCGAPTKGGATGVGVFNPDGTVGVNFTIVTSPAGQGVQVSALVSPASGQGTWSDSVGNSGTFAFFGATPGLPPRPLLGAPIDIAANPGQPSDPCLVPTPPTLVLCGTSSSAWQNGGYGLPGLQVWRDQLGQVHIRGSVSRTTGAINGSDLFMLPQAFRPKRHMLFAVATSSSAGAIPAGTAHLFIYAADFAPVPGRVSVFNPSDPTHRVVHFGEIVFRVDQ